MCNKDYLKYFVWDYNLLISLISYFNESNTQTALNVVIVCSLHGATQTHTGETQKTKLRVKKWRQGPSVGASKLKIHFSLETGHFCRIGKLLGFFIFHEKGNLKAIDL